MKKSSSKLRTFLIAGIITIIGTMSGISSVQPAKAAPPAIVWSTCPSFPDSPPTPDLECGTLSVPLDYQKSNGEKINVAVSRLKSQRPDLRHGVMLLNPGGPGGPGLDMPIWLGKLMPQSVLNRYDLIGFDPRGVERSAPVACGLTTEKGFEVAPPFEQDGSFDATASFMQQVAGQCGQLSGAHLRYINTANTARDMDQIRQALGEGKISYYGLSYGTYLGAVYASLFPSRSDRFVFDSSTDPMANWREAFRRFSQADESRFPDFAAFAAANDADYGLGTTPAEVKATYFQLYNQVTQHPVPLPDPELNITINGPWFRALTFSGMYFDSSFADTAQLWKLIKEQQSPVAMAPLVKTLRPYAPTGFPDIPADNAGASTLAIVCGDTAWSRNVEQYRQELNADTARYPIFGPVASTIWACAFWPSQPIEPPVTITSNGPSNILMMQNERDPATPYANALDMKAALGNRARFITVDQGGHGATYETENECSKDTVNDYFATGVLPTADFTCPAILQSPLTADQKQAAQMVRQRTY